MKLQLVAVGTKMPDWVQTGFMDYLHRFPKDMPFELTGSRRANAAKRRHQAHSGQRRRTDAGGGGQRQPHRYAGYPRHAVETPQLAQQLERWKQDGRNVSLLIGGPEGLAPACKAAAEQSWSLSPLTLPHPLVRVLVAESLYRAWSITTNHPYHRE